MNEIIKITEQNGKRAVSARELHHFLGSKQEFANWIKSRIEKYGFIENQDFEVFDNFIKNPQGGRPLTEYALSVDMAKEISMVEGTERGKQARQYFIQCEKQLAKASLPSYQLSDPIERAQKWIQEEQQRKQLALENLNLQTINEEKQHVIELQEREIKQAAPKVEYYEKVLQSEGLYTITFLANELGITNPSSLNKKLFECGFLKRQSGTWLLSSPFSSWNLHQMRTTTYERANGETSTSSYVVYNERGRRFIRAIHDSGFNVNKAIKIMQAN